MLIHASHPELMDSSAKYSNIIILYYQIVLTSLQANSVNCSFYFLSTASVKAAHDSQSHKE